MLLNEIEKYFSDRIYKPFFVAVGDEEYLGVILDLQQHCSVNTINLSKYCKQDKKPDLDRFMDALREADVDCNDNKLLILGLGEYLALEGDSFTRKILNELKDFNLGTARAVFLLRGVTSQVIELSKSDIRLQGRQVVVGKYPYSEIKYQFAYIDTSMYEDINGFKQILEHIEAGDTDIQANTSLEFPNSLSPIRRIRNSYEAIQKKLKLLSIPKIAGSDDEWDALLKDINMFHTLDNIFNHYNISYSDVDFYNQISGLNGYINWLYYIYLRIYSNNIQNKYLIHVINKTNNFNEFKHSILNEISHICHNEKEFQRLYLDRKKLIKSYPESELSEFISSNRRNSDESIYKLTDNTLLERREIIADISQHSIPDNLDKIYSDLDLYLKPFSFGSGELMKVLTQYFNEYKLQKVTNTIKQEFLEQVNDLAKKRIYNTLPARDSLLPASTNDGDTFLCWIDALGAEYTGYINQLANKHGLNISIKIGRSNLPTITEFNKKFFDEWPDNLRLKISDLDNLKHKKLGEYYFKESNYPKYLADELKIISDLFEKAKIELALGKYKFFVFVGDHGSSRLAVLHKEEEKYSAETKGEHSGRCCLSFPTYNHDLEFACEENGYIVLANYGRFKYSHAAAVETHGGASLEEVVVPVVILSLKDSSIKIEFNPDDIKADYKNGVTLKFFVQGHIKSEMSIVYNNNRYECMQTDDTHYLSKIIDIKRAGDYEADVYVGYNLISHIKFTAKSKSASFNDKFDDLL